MREGKGRLSGPGDSPEGSGNLVGRTAANEATDTDGELLPSLDPGTEGPDRMFGSRGGDTLNGFGSDYIMYGQRGRDTLLGGSEVDYLIDRSAGGG
jgi:Ca2+-binding RTX toxin-like protein